MTYHPGTWAKLSAVVAGGGYLTNIVWASRHGVDTSLAAFLHVFMILMLAILPMVVGTFTFYTTRRSQRAGDWAFSACMVAQGLFLAIAPAL